MLRVELGTEGEVRQNGIGLLHATGFGRALHLRLDELGGTKRGGVWEGRLGWLGFVHGTWLVIETIHVLTVRHSFKNNPKKEKRKFLVTKLIRVVVVEVFPRNKSCEEASLWVRR